MSAATPGRADVTNTLVANSGASSSLVAYARLWANGDTWLQLDDVSVVGL